MDLLSGACERSPKADNEATSRATGSDPDVLFIGSGASATYTLIHLIDALIESGTAAHIVVLEKQKEHHAGIAYGTRSGSDALILTTLRDFFPPEELERFIDWVLEHDRLDQLMPVGLDAELDPVRHGETDARDVIPTLCVRRRAVGSYLRARARAAMDRGRRTGLISVRLQRGQAVQMSRSVERGRPGLSTRYLTDGREGVLHATRVVLCLGGPPSTVLQADGARVDDPRVMSDPYGADYDAALDRLRATLARRRSPTLTVLGSNASAMEVLYTVEGWVRAGLEDLSVRVVSTSGKLPELRDERSIGPLREVTIDQALRRFDEIDGHADAETLYREGTAVLQDLGSEAVLGAIHMRRLDTGMLEALKRLSPRELKNFIESYGNRLGRYKRRTERQYFDAAQRLRDAGRLSLVAARMVDMTIDEDTIALELDEAQGRRVTVQTDALINCGSSQAVDAHSSDPLITSLIESGLAHPSDGGSGFSVFDSYIISNGLYAMGPMLSGNVVAGEPVWHMEHCGRIFRYSRTLAMRLAHEIDAARAPLDFPTSVSAPSDRAGRDAPVENSATRTLFVFGASGHAKVVLDILAHEDSVPVAGLIDLESRKGHRFSGYPVLGQMEDLSVLAERHGVRAGIVAIGDNATRAAVVEKIIAVMPDFKFVSAVHPHSTVSTEAVVGVGSVVAAGATVNAGTRLGEHCIVNTNASVDHDCKLGAFSSIAPNAALGGGCRIGTCSAVSISATLLHGVTVGPYSVIGAAALVLDDMPDHVVAYGQPCRIKRVRKSTDSYLQRRSDLI